MFSNRAREKMRRRMIDRTGDSGADKLEGEREPATGGIQEALQQQLASDMDHASGRGSQL